MRSNILSVIAVLSIPNNTRFSVILMLQAVSQLVLGVAGVDSGQTVSSPG